MKLEFDNTEIAFASQNNQTLRKNYFLYALMNKTWFVKYGSVFIKNTINILPPVKWAVKKTVFSLFCGGENIADCQKKIERLGTSKIGTIFDYSVESSESESSFDATTEEILRTIEQSKRQPQLIPFAVFKVTGVGSFDLLEKMQSSPNSLSKPELEAFDRIKQRIERLCLTAFENSVRLFFDAEETWIQDTIDILCNEMMKKYNKKDSILIYNTYQFYRRDTLSRFITICETAKNNNFAIGAKLVRGAYMEKERLRATQMNYLDPIQPSKESTDIDFNKSIIYAINHLDSVNICLGTHNETSSKMCADIMKESNISPNDNRVWFAQLLGMSDNITYNLANSGYNIAKYVPYGPVKAVIPYLLRRAEENTSIAGQSSREYQLLKKEIMRRKVIRKN